MERLIDPELSASPVVVPHHRGRKRMHLGEMTSHKDDTPLAESVKQCQRIFIATRFAPKFLPCYVHIGCVPHESRFSLAAGVLRRKDTHEVDTMQSMICAVCAVFTKCSMFDIHCVSYDNESTLVSRMLLWKC